MRIFCFVVLLFAFEQRATSIPLADFYPFGSENGDASNPPIDDGSSPLIQLSFSFPFFGNGHSSLYVNNNGLISFNVRVGQFTSEPFPLGDGRMIIAPYWADNNIARSGRIWRRETSDSDLLARAGRRIRSAFPSQMSFTPTSLYIATWDEVPYFGGPSNVNNTFQCVLVTDQVMSFVIFNYADGQIRWTTGTASGGRDGVGGTEAQVGFNAGDGVRFFSVPGSQTPDIINIDTTSNVGVAGVWVFRVDTDEMIEPMPCTNGAGAVLSIGPRSGSQYGGTAIYVSGPCFDENDVIRCFFNGAEESDSGTIGYYMSGTMAICVSPMFETPGWKSLRVGIGTGETMELSGRTRFYAEHPDSTTHIRLEQETLLLRADSNERLNITWNPQSLLPTMDPSLYTVDITLYRFQLDSENQVQFSYFLHVVRDHANNGTALFTAPESNELGGIYPIAIRISIGRANRSSGEVSSVVGRLGRPIEGNTLGVVAQWTSTLYYLDSPQFTRLISAWSTSQQGTGIGEAVRNRLPPCPPRMDQARAPNSGMSEDTGYWILKSNRFFHPGAATCFRQSTFESSHMGSGQQCCYRESGELLTGARSGGTVDSVAPIGLTNSVRHFYDDIIPAVFCCKGHTVDSMNPCSIYYEHRPSDNGSRYNPPPPACVYGDPHIVTLDGFKYTFNGLGEYTLIETGDDAFTLQGRMVLATNETSSPVPATVFSAIVGRELYSDTVQFQLMDELDEENSDVAVLVNGEMLDFGNLAEQELVNVTVRKGENSASAVFSTGIYIEVRAANGILSTLLVSMAERYRSQTSGLMGNFNEDQSDDLRPRNRNNPLPLTSSLANIHNQFGVTWIINSSADSLFTYTEEDSWSTYYSPFFQPVFAPIFSNPVLELEANVICGDDPFCLFDIAATGRTDIGLTTLQGNIEFEVIANISRPVVCNPPCEFGVCVQNDTCSCADGYTGVTCAQSIVGECDTNPCQNGGTCTLIATSYVCSCLEGYSGLFCEERDAPPFSGSGDITPPSPFDCTCTRDIECSFDGQLKDLQITPITNKLNCIIKAVPEPDVREKIIIDDTFSARYLSPGSFSFLSSIGVLQRDRGFSSCILDVGSSSDVFLEALGVQSLSITYTESDGSFGSLGITATSMQEIISEQEDFTLGMDLDEVNRCSLLNLLQWLLSPQSAQLITCMDIVDSDGDTTYAYFPINCNNFSLGE